MAAAAIKALSMIHWANQRVRPMRICLPACCGPMMPNDAWMDEIQRTRLRRATADRQRLPAPAAADTAALQMREKAFVREKYKYLAYPLSQGPLHGARRAMENVH